MTEPEDALAPCATEGCEGEGTEELGDTYVCMSCYQRLADEAYERHRDREEG